MARRVTALRQARGLTKAAFARSCGITPQGVSNWETGGQMVSIQMAHRIVEAWPVDFDYIYRGTLDGIGDENLKAKIQEKLRNPREPG